MVTEVIKEILQNYRVVAVVGLSADPDKPSFQVAKYLKTHDFKIIPINPGYENILGESCYPDLLTANEFQTQLKIEIVDIFRRPEFVMPHVDEAIRIGAKIIWMQEGIINEPAGEKARNAGLMVVMDKCMMGEYRRLVEDNKTVRQ